MRVRTGLIMAAIAGAIAVVAFAVRPSREAAPVAPVVPDVDRAVVESPRARVADPSAARALPPRWDERPPAVAPKVDRVELDKPAACIGEEILVTVHATAGDDAAFVHGSIDGRAGLRVPFLVQRSPDGTAVRPQVVIEGRGGPPTVVEGPAVEILDCVTEYRALIATRERVNTIDEYDFSAEVAYAGDTPFVPVRFAWTFGDGATAESTGAAVTHSYGERPQDRLYSDFVVGVEARDDRGRVASGRTTLSLRNPAFDRLVRDREVVLFAEPRPRFGVPRPDGVLVQEVRIWHHRPGVVALDAVTMQSTQRDGTVTMGLEQDPGASLGIDAVPPEGVTITLSFRSEEVASLASRELRLFGASEEGLPAKGVFTILFVPVEDPPLAVDIGPPPPDEAGPEPSAPREAPGPPPPGTGNDKGQP